MAEVEVIVTKDLSSGRFHKRFRLDGRTLVDERCNLDQAGEYEVMPTVSRGIDGRGVPVGTESSLLCKYDFPDDADEFDVA